MSAEIHVLYNWDDRREGMWLVRHLCSFRMEGISSVEAKPITVSTLSEMAVEEYHGNDRKWEECSEDTWLIVVCSRKAARNALLDEMIRNFQENVSIRVLPYVVNGVPYSKDEKKECLPPRLRLREDQELFAANTLVKGRRYALLSVIAAIRNIPFDSLWRSRDRYRRFVKRALITLAVLFSVYLVWDYYEYNFVERFYRSYVYCNGEPQGVDSLNLLQRLWTEEYYTFRMVSGHVHEVTRHGEAKEICQDGYSGLMDPYRILIFRDYLSDEEFVDSLVYLDENGSFLMTANYLAGLSCVDFSLDPSCTTPFYITPGGTETDATRCLLTRDGAGYVTRAEFRASTRNEPVCNQLGCTGLAFVRDEDGLILETIPVYPEGAE